MSDDDKRSRIIAAAAEAYREQGFTGTRISDIAQHAKVGKGTVYEYYRSKEELLLEACLHTCQANEEAMGAIIGSPLDPEADWRDLTEGGLHPVKAAHQVLKAVLLVLLQRSTYEQRLFSELFTVMQTHPDLGLRARETFSQKMIGWRRQAHALYELCQQTGYFRTIPAAEDAAHLIVATVDGLIWQRFWEDDIPADDRAKRIADVWCRLQMCEPERLEEFLA